MSEIKNLFEFATKELEQDAFLRWLFESWKDPKINQIVHRLLEHFCDLEEDDSFADIETQAQWGRSDLRIDFSTEKKGKSVLLIEDKTFSQEHSNQLKRYNECIDSLPAKNKYKVFYKTSYIESDEHQRIVDAGWKEYDLDKIFDLFLPFENTDVFLVSQYIEYLKMLKEMYNTTEKPENSESKFDLIRWKAFFKKTIIPSLEKEQHQIQFEIYPAVIRYGYTCLIIVRKSEEERITPYIEIRSRDCTKKEFKALVLGYDISEQLLKEKGPALIERATSGNFWETKNLRHKAEKEPKQMCYYKTSLEKDTAEEFVEKTLECMDEYIKLLEAWDNGIG